MPTVVRPPLPPATRPSARGRLHGDSFSYACPGLNSHACRHSVTLVQSLDASLLTVEAGPVKVQGRLVMIGPLVERTLRGDRVRMSQAGAAALTADQVAALARAGFELAPVPLDEIEKAGGSLRCCVAEIY